MPRWRSTAVISSTVRRSLCLSGWIDRSTSPLRSQSGFLWGRIGGGSSDAAATILGLVRLLGLGWSVQQMAEVGQQLGSDVPFFFVAPAACVTGRGEVVRPVQVTGQRWIVLVNPGFPVETKWAYQQLAATRQGVRPLSDSLQQLGTAQRWIGQRLFPGGERL